MVMVEYIESDQHTGKKDFDTRLRDHSVCGCHAPVTSSKVRMLEALLYKGGCDTEVCTGKNAGLGSILFAHDS